MPPIILIAPDKFKGTLTASEAARAIAKGWQKGRPNDVVDLLPITDGGDGFGDVMSNLWRARSKTIRTVDAAHRPIQSRWWWEPSRKAAIIESAEFIGLAQLPHRRFHPFELDTRGLASVMVAASDYGARHCIVGIGGSATNDGGFGLARALGWKFVDSRGQSIERWPDLHRLARIKAPVRRKWFRQLIVAVDVQNPLLGKHGASRVYGPQKGLTPPDFPMAEKALRRLRQVVTNERGKDFANLPGAGAAGGLGFGLAAFLNARLEPGFDLFAREADLVSRVKQADLVITGEGRLDASTMMGKGVGEMAKLCQRLKIPCLGLAGELVPAAKLKLFEKTWSLGELTNLTAARIKARYWLEKLAEKAAQEISRKRP
jgi:glycerate kinase